MCDYLFKKKNVYQENRVFGVSAFVVPLGEVMCSEVDGKAVLSLQCQ